MLFTQGSRFNFAPLALDPLDLSFDFLAIFRVEPFFVPVDPFPICSFSAFCSSLENEFGHCSHR